ncbi:MAG TPA: hypothetical protein VGV40_01495 [Solirubrobacteraceae bacterium]|nr:hypothetical protein [Solirubrobacteraceae bacterium]
MGTEERLLLRLALLFVGLVLILGAAASGTYARGRPIWLAVAIGLVGIFVVYGRLVSLRGGRAPGSAAQEAAKGAASRLRRASRRALARLRGRRRRGRVRQVELAAVEAAKDDELLAPERVRMAADSLFRLVQLARGERDRGRLASLMGGELLTKWERRLASAAPGERVEVVGDVEVEYVGFTAASADESPRAVVLIEAELLIDGEARPLCEFWTLGLRGGRWTVLAIEGHREGSHQLNEPIGAAPDA